MILHTIRNRCSYIQSETGGLTYNQKEVKVYKQKQAYKQLLNLIDAIFRSLNAWQTWQRIKSWCCRKVQHLEAELETFEDKMLLAAQKLDVVRNDYTVSKLKHLKILYCVAWCGGKSFETVSKHLKILYCGSCTEAWCGEKG